MFSPLSLFRPGRIRNRHVLGGGYGALILLLIVSAVEAYRIQREASLHSVDIYHRHVKEGDALYRLRRTLYRGGVYTRDLLLSDRPDRVAIFKAQLAQLQHDSLNALDDLDRLPAPHLSTAALRSKMQEYWITVAPMADWPDEVRASRGFAFLQQESSPRRNAISELVRELTEASENTLKNSETEFARGRRSAALRLSLFVGLCIIFGLAVAGFSLAHSEALEREAARQYAQLEQLSARLLEVQEDERRKIARELHDEIGQTLTALRMEVSHAQSLARTRSPGVEERLDRARSLAEKTVRTVRDISLLLRPPLLDDLGLADALQWHVEDFTRRTGILCEFSDDGLPDSLPDSWRICVYRIVQEALRNCETHAAASSVRVSVRQSRQQLLVRIEDNGCGFPADPQAAGACGGGLGILGMRERAAMLGGTLAIDSAPGRGTRLTLSLPLSAVPPVAAIEEVRA
ncbi:MAG: sensor histidine kinase [Acidobacteria bacterium]|nr:sensor histidine kinase [Acidobacteriota bacterium]